VKRFDRLEQQSQLAPCVFPSDDNERGALALRSFLACAVRASPERLEQYGAVSVTRGAVAAQLGHSDGKSLSAIGRICVNGPQPSQRYS
jgi:hypothetical protein